MAGTWGLKRKNFRTSLRIGWGLISELRSRELQARRPGMFYVQDANGTGRRQAGHSSVQAACSRVWIDARR